MTIQRMDHVGVVVDDLGAAVDFFRELGLSPQGDGTVQGSWVDRIIGLEGAVVDFAMMKTPDGKGGIELVQFHSPPIEGDERPLPANTRGLRHLCFAVDDVDDVVARLQKRGATLVGEIVNYEDVFRLCYIRGPSEIIIELAEPVGQRA
jgi:catechol 2,3-dioxygenase-like lactoylglutathione lyase family enzyme